jgi:hypothetical protein
MYDRQLTPACLIRGCRDFREVRLGVGQPFDDAGLHIHD